MCAENISLSNGELYVLKLIGSKYKWRVLNLIR